ncbi:MAG: hypothetical protein ACRDZ6_08230, partial [Acidimicrobiales bacterium]
ELARPLVGVGPRQPERLGRPDGDVAPHRHVREEVEGLEDDAYVAPDEVLVDVGPGDVAAEENYAAAVTANDLFIGLPRPRERRGPGPNGVGNSP